MIKKNRKYPFFNKELSWLSFNERVLQEAEDSRNPIGERIKFMGIYSSNLDEFFRVRVAMVRRLCQMGKVGENLLMDPPLKALKKIQKVVNLQRERFTSIMENLYKEMEKDNLYLLTNVELDEEQREYVKEYFNREIRHKIFPIMVDKRYKLPDLKDKTLYLAVQLKHFDKGGKNTKYCIIEIPTQKVPRFIPLPRKDEKQNIVLIDEVIRLGLPSIFRNKKETHIEAWNIKVVRDSEIDIDDDDHYTSYLNKMNKGVEKRKDGAPIWFLYDETMPPQFLNLFISKHHFKPHDTITSGGRYHYFSHFIDFPRLVNLPVSSKLEPLSHKNFKSEDNFFSMIKKRDTLLYFPYHSFDSVIDLLREASIDPKVQSIKVTLYRVANFSSVINALINARKNRKEVIVILELKARFDEKNNIHWANVLKENDIKVIFGVEGLKVHSKVLLITRREKNELFYYGGIGTGNLNEDTSRHYTDCFLLTANQNINKEILDLFNFFENNYKHCQTNNILISPYNLRSKLYELIDKEIAFAQEGKEASIKIKLNNLSDEGIIQKLYEASNAGVKIKLIVRGRFSLVPGVENFSSNIEAISILDQYLEHARFFIFHNGGNSCCYISSADWLTRNIDRRIEVTCPIYDKEIKKQLLDIFELQWHDNQKSRILDKELSNKYRIKHRGEEIHRSQIEVYHYFKQISQEED